MNLAVGTQLCFFSHLSQPGAGGTEAERGSVTRSMFGCELGLR